MKAAAFVPVPLQDHPSAEHKNIFTAQIQTVQDKFFIAKVWTGFKYPDFLSTSRVVQSGKKNLNGTFHESVKNKNEDS